MILEYAEFDKAVKLQGRLFRLTDTDIKHTDILSEYRKWLDKNNIKAETDGFPSEEAYQESNIQSFINDFIKEIK